MARSRHAPGSPGALTAPLGEVALRSVAGRETFGHALGRLREKAGITRPDLGKVARVAVATVGEWERDVGAPTKREFWRMVKAIPGIKYFPPDFAVDPMPEGTLVVEGPPDEVRKIVRNLVGEIADASEEVALMAGLERAIDAAGGDERIVESTRRWLEEPESAAERALRRDAFKRTVPRETRQALGLTDAALEAARPKAPLAIRPAGRRCPRCQAEVQDLKAHRVVCAKRNWEREGWRSCEAVSKDSPHRWNVNGAAIGGRGGPPEDEELRVEPCPAHRKSPGNQARDWKKEGWRVCTAMGVGHEHRWNVDLSLMRVVSGSPLPDIDFLDAETCPRCLRDEVSPSPAPSEDAAHQVPAQVSARDAALLIKSDGPPTAPDSGAPRGGDSLDLVERCLVLADMLWPGERHAFILDAGPTFELESGWNASICVTRSWDPRAHGEGTSKESAVRALADALRAETKERARAASEMARLLED